jgi:hypothetical protein
MAASFWGTVVGCMIAAAPAHAAADHCAPGKLKAANVHLAVAGTNDGLRDDRQFTFSGRVACGDAERLDIHRLELRRGDELVASAEPRSCTNCDQTIASATHPASPGRYAVFMRYSVRAGGEADEQRIAVYSYDWWGSGHPYGSDRADLATRCDPAGKASVDFVPDTGTTRTAKALGRIVCPGAQYLVILDLVVFGPDGQPRELGHRPSCSGVQACADGLDAALGITDQSAGSVDKLGRYDVRMNAYGRGPDGREFTVAIGAPYRWAGLGPAFRE